MLIRTNALRGLVEADVGSTPVTDRWTEISALLSQRCGSDVAALFAEPQITRSNGASEAIARWYTEADGPTVSFSALDAGARATAAAQLTSLMSRLEPALRDPASSALLGPCVQIPSMADVMIVAGRPVIVNWGFLPEEIATSPARRESHFRTTLGQYLPGIAAPAFNVGSGAAARAAPVGATAAAAATAAGAARAATAAGPAVAAAAPVVVERQGRPWLPVAIATGIALLVLLVLLIPGVLIYPDRGAVSASEIALRREINKSLEEYVNNLKRQSAEAVCTAQNPGGAKPDQSTASAGGTGGTRPLASAQLLAELEKSTVLVIIATADGSTVEEIGSGFFVNDHQIVTNRHVVQDAKPDRVFVVNKALTRPFPAKVVGVTAAAVPGGQDFALLEIPQASGIPGLALAEGTERLNPVTAAGFTGALVFADQGFKKLLLGDLAAMPEMVVTQGIVTVIQQGAGGASLIYHTATISGGNSGGPLADACGRVVAVNTFNRIDPQRPIAFNGALASSNLAAFLTAGHINFSKTSGTCGANAPEPPAPAPSPPAAPPTPKTPESAPPPDKK